MEGPAGFSASLWCRGNHGVVDGRMDGESLFSICLFRRRVEDGRGGHPPNTYGSSGYSFSDVGGGGGGCGGRALG